MPLRVQNQNSKTRKGLKQKEKEKANSTRDEKKGVTWASTTRCTLSDLCAPDKKKISNLISKVVELNSANEKLEAELATFRKESEKLRNENMELHKLNGSLQTRLMQSLVLTKTYQDQIKHEKRVFSMGATDAGKSSAPTKTTLNPIIDFSNRRERDSDKGENDGVRPKPAKDDSKPTSAPTVSKLDKTTLEDRTLYFDSAYGSSKIHSFNSSGAPQAQVEENSEKKKAPRAPDPRPAQREKSTSPSTHLNKNSQQQREEDGEERELEVDSSLEDLIDVINTSQVNKK